MKFCMVTTFYPPYHFGGDAVYIYRLTNELARRGHLVDVIHDRDAYYLAHPAEPSGRFENHPNVTVHALKSRFGPLSPLATQQTTLPLFKGEVKRVLETGNHDVIHFHNISLIGPGAFAYGRGVKLQTLHEHWLVCPMHVLWKFDREVCTQRQCLACTLHGRRPPQLWRYTGLLKRHLRHIDQFISPSRFTRDKHSEYGLNLPVTVLNYFLPNSQDGGAEASPHPRPYFLFVGRLVKIKGLQTLLPVFKRYPQADLLVAGDGTDGPMLRALAGDAPNIKFLGPVPHAQLRTLYRHAVALIMPSICYEVFGIVLIEAFQVKTPVIVRDLGGMPEAVADSNGGLLFRTDEELVQAMSRLQNDAAYRRTLGENGYAAYVDRWSEEPHMRGYFQIIDDAGRRKRASGKP